MRGSGRRDGLFEYVSASVAGAASAAARNPRLNVICRP